MRIAGIIFLVLGCVFLLLAGASVALGAQAYQNSDHSAAGLYKLTCIGALVLGIPSTILGVVLLVVSWIVRKARGGLNRQSASPGRL